MINQKLLEQQIEVLENSLITSKIELIKLPIFLNQIQKELDNTKDEEKRKELERLLENNKIQAKWHTESIENVEEILKQVYLLRK